MRLLNLPSITCSVLGAAALSVTQTDAALLLHYSFDNDAAGAVATGGTITNDANPVGPGVAAVPSGSMNVVSDTAGQVCGPTGTLGHFLTIAPNADGDADLNAPHISTGASFADFNIVTSADDWTMAAWVRFDNQNGDNMVFGQAENNGGTGNQRLHYGSRGNQYWSGHWGDDLNSGTTTTDPGNWHHVTWTNSAGTQEIFVDGVSVASGPGGGASADNGNPNDALTVLIGTSGNGGSFAGALDDVRIYDEVLDGTAINGLVDIAKIPEPSGVALMGLAGIGLILRRRR